MKITSDEIMKVVINGGLEKNSKKSDVLTSNEELLMLTQPMCSKDSSRGLNMHFAYYCKGNFFII
jgi:hydroxymethylpyrimidine/phosphomethylpyrimidine kinase